MIETLDNLLLDIQALQWPLPLVIIMGIMGVIALIAYAAKSLTGGGAIGAFFMGLVILWSLGSAGFLLLLLFFISCTVVGKISKKLRSSQKGEVAEKKGHTRDLMQVLANGLMATIAALFWSVSLEIKASIMFGAAVAEATSDTFAGEIGRLSKRKPVSILNFRQVPVGLSGGITPLGLLAAFLSSALIGLCWYLWFVDSPVTGAILVSTTGFAGCILDSVLGAGVQGIYYDPKSKQFSEAKEKDGRQLELSRGIRWVDNDVVNLMSNVFAGVFALGMAALIL